jgi:hypothetical protein
MSVTYSISTISYCILKTLHGSVFVCDCVIDDTAYFARVVGYARKMFMTSATGYQS